MLMDQVDTLHYSRYWSEVLCCTIMTHLGDLEVKVTDLEILCLSFWLICRWIKLILCMFIRSRSWVNFNRDSGKAQVRRATLSCDSSYFMDGCKPVQTSKMPGHCVQKQSFRKKIIKKYY